MMKWVGERGERRRKGGVLIDRTKPIRRVGFLLRWLSMRGLGQFVVKLKDFFFFCVIKH